jgi:threonine synthase
MKMTIQLVCTNCKREYPKGKVLYRCPTCGGLYDFATPFPFEPGRIDESQPGMWKYRHGFGLREDYAPVSLGEGNTPLVWATVHGRKVGFKCEYLNPSGSFKDRGSTVITTWLKANGVKDAVEDSSGNAGASFAAYATRGEIRARIFVPESAAGPKRKQIEAYGAELVPIPGSRSDVTEATKREVEKGAIYASHAALPFNLPGYATVAYEISEQTGIMPDAIIVPAGQGGLLLGIKRGFDALRIAKKEMKTPKIIGVQARACAPLWAMFASGRQGLALVAENPTLAEGVRVRYPLRGEAVLKAVAESGGSMVAVDEDEILPSQEELAHLGFYVEPTSALVWPALLQFIDELQDPIILILTGSGLKYGVK